MNKPVSLLAGAVSAALFCTPAHAEESRRSSLEQTGIDRARTTAGTQFNPSISVILDAVYSQSSRELESPAGFDGHDHGHGHDDHGQEDGFSLRESEISLSASIDNYLDGVVTLGIEGNSGIAVEEAYLLTRALPAGLQIKAGRFLSDIGYMNRQHPHDWQFVDRPLVNELLFGEHGLQDTGVQLSWMPASQHYTRVGIEALQGEGGIASYEGEGEYTLLSYEDVGGVPVRRRWQADTGLEDKAGPRLFTAFAKFGPDLGFDHAALFGLSGGYSTAFQAMETHSSGRLETWDGKGWFAGADATYKYSSGKPFGHGNWVVQAEYFFREIEADYASQVFTDSSTLELTSAGGTPDAFFSRSRQDGFYLQGIYGFAPRWSAGLRVEAVGMTNKSLETNDDRDNFVSFDASWRYTGQISFMPTEFSRLRLQVSQLDYAHGDEDDHHHSPWTVMLQYNVSLGAHGAHQF